MLICFSAFGWERYYGRLDYWDWCYSVAQLKDSSYVLGGLTYRPSVLGEPIRERIWFLKIDQDGDTIWSKIYNVVDSSESSWSFCLSICATFDGGFACTGWRGGTPTTRDVFLMKLDSNGDSLWCKKYNIDDSPSPEGNQVIQTSDSGYAIIVYGIAGGGVVRTNSEGDSLWIAPNPYPHMGGGARITEAVDGDIVVGGEFSYRVSLWRINPEGETRWFRPYGSGLETEGRFVGGGVHATDDNGIVWVGHIKTPPHPLPTDDVYIMKVNADGDSLWAYTYKDETQVTREYRPSADKTADGGFIIAANALRFTAIDSVDSTYLYLVKTDSLGLKVWDRCIVPLYTDDTTCVAGWTIKQTYDKGYILGAVLMNQWNYTTGGSAMFDYYAMKLDSLGNSVSSSISEYLHLPHKMQIYSYPNPFNSAVTIAVDCRGLINQTPTVEIFDLNGRKIDVIARRAEPNEAISPNNRSSVPLDTRRDAVSINNCEFIWQPHESLPSGVYLVRARVGGRGDLAPTGQAATKRIVYLK